MFHDRVYGRLVREKCDVIGGTRVRKLSIFYISSSPFAAILGGNLLVFVMSSTDSSSEPSSFASENDYLSEYDEMSGPENLQANVSEAEQIETFDDVTAEITVADSPLISSDDDVYAWIDDPVADEEWTKQYEENLRANEIIKENMLKRLHGTTDLNEWLVAIFLYYIFYKFSVSLFTLWHMGSG